MTQILFYEPNTIFMNDEGQEPTFPSSRHKTIGLSYMMFPNESTLSTYKHVLYKINILQAAKAGHARKGFSYTTYYVEDLNVLKVHKTAMQTLT